MAQDGITSLRSMPALVWRGPRVLAGRGPASTHIGICIAHPRCLLRSRLWHDRSIQYSIQPGLECPDRGRHAATGHSSMRSAGLTNHQSRNGNSPNLSIDERARYVQRAGESKRRRLRPCRYHFRDFFAPAEPRGRTLQCFFLEEHAAIIENDGREMNVFFLGLFSAAHATHHRVHCEAQIKTAAKCFCKWKRTLHQLPLQL